MLKIVKENSVKGFGVKTKSFIKANTIVTEYKGEIIRYESLSLLENIFLQLGGGIFVLNNCATHRCH